MFKPYLPREMREAPVLNPYVVTKPPERFSALLINPFYRKDPYASFGKHVLTPSLALTSIAGATPEHWTVSYWDEQWRERTELLDRVVAYFTNHRWAIKVDSGWTDSDVEIYCHPWTVLHLCTAQEDHGSGRRLLRVRYRMQASEYLRALLAVTAGIALCALGLQSLPLAVVCGILGGACQVLWLHGRTLASRAAGLVEMLALEMELTVCDRGNDLAR